MPETNNYFFSPAELRWELEEEWNHTLRMERQRDELYENLVKQIAPMIKPPPQRVGPRAYLWKASLPGGQGVTVTGKIQIDDPLDSEDIVRMRSYQKFKRHVELRAATPGTAQCLYRTPSGETYEVGYFPTSGANPRTGNIHLPTAMADLERYVVLYVYSDVDAQRDLDAVDRRPRGPEFDVAIYDEIQQFAAPKSVATAGEDIADVDCASGCLCPLDGQDVASMGQELDL